jgi:hypothetical protein
MPYASKHYPFEFENKKNEACISKGVGLNCPAKASSSSIISKNIKKVNNLQNISV